MNPNTRNAPIRGHHPDYLLALGVFVLLAIGLILIYSISPILSQSLAGKAGRNYYFVNQVQYLVLGLVAWAVVSRIPYRLWKRWAPWLMGVSIILLLLLFTPLRYSSLGATRWVKLGPLTMQPAELLKFSLIVYLAAWFERRADDLQTFWDGVLPFIVMVGLASFVIVVLQKDMGTMLVVLFSAIGMYFAAGLRWKHLVTVLGIAFILGAFAIAAFPHRVQRVTTFAHLNCQESAAALGDSYQVCQALLAVGSGGLGGVGLGHSIQVYGYLPEAANDSIFAIIGEEFGVIGSLAVVGLFGFVVYRGFLIAMEAPDMFSRLTAIGISLWLLFQSVINIGAMLALLPLTGIPLPFISYGGSSLVITLVGVGVLLQISRFTVKEATHADSRERRGNRRAHLADTGYGRRVNVPR
jgi:cell division protein FtsW